jgi:hypothetical protein
MTKHSIILAMVMIGLVACSPDKQQALRPPTGKVAAAKSADVGQTPLHQAGYAWAAQHKIVNPRNCQGKSESFIEGCWAYTGAEGPFGQKEVFQDED